MPKQTTNQYQTIFNAIPDPGFDSTAPVLPRPSFSGPGVASSFITSDWTIPSSDILQTPPHSQFKFVNEPVLAAQRSQFRIKPRLPALASPITYYDETSQYSHAGDHQTPISNALDLTSFDAASQNNNTFEAFNIESTPALSKSPLSPLESPLLLFDANASLLSRDNTDWSPTSDHPSQSTHRRAPKVSKSQLFTNLLSQLRKSNFSILDMLLYVFDDANTDFSSYIPPFFGSDKFTQFLDLMYNHKKAGPFRKWMENHATDIVCTTISSEMEAAKSSLHMSSTDVSLDFLRNWDINSIINPEKLTPTWSRILFAATESKKSVETDRHRPEGRNLITAQVHYIRSQESAKAQIGLGLMLISSGTARQVINVLHRSGFTVSFNTLSKLLKSLSKQALAHARAIAKGPICVTYDNINISGSIYAEQTFNTMSKVQSGSFAVIYEVPNLCHDVYNPAILRQRLLNSAPLTLKDLRPSTSSATMYTTQIEVHICQVLLTYADEFLSYQSRGSLLLKNTPRRQHPEGHRTNFHTLRATIIEEASISGNILVHEDIFITQLKKTSDELNNFAIPSINDQLTNSRIRSIKAVRKNDISYWERRDILQVAFAPFHMVMNLNNALLQVHRGRDTQLGTLSSLFAILGKVRLNNDHPDYHTLLMALMEILDGLILNAWRCECGFPSLQEFAASKPTPDKLREIARVIISKYTSPTVPAKLTEKLPKKNESQKASSQDDYIFPKAIDDPIFENVKRLTRDLLIVKEITTAISAGDFGRIEDLLPRLACVFRGAGSNNYSTEILHFIFNLKSVWTTDFANVMRDMMIVNVSGIDGHAMGIDMNIEHMIRSLKTLFASKGVYANWDRLGDISAAISYLSIIKKQVIKSTKSSYQGSTHQSPDVAKLVWVIANHARDNKLQETVANRASQTECILVPDLATVGLNKFASASLETFEPSM